MTNHLYRKAISSSTRASSARTPRAIPINSLICRSSIRTLEYFTYSDKFSLPNLYLNNTNSILARLTLQRKSDFVAGANTYKAEHRHPVTWAARRFFHDVTVMPYGRVRARKRPRNISLDVLAAPSPPAGFANVFWWLNATKETRHEHATDGFRLFPPRH